MMRIVKTVDGILANHGNHLPKQIIEDLQRVDEVDSVFRVESGPLQ